MSAFPHSKIANLGRSFFCNQHMLAPNLKFVHDMFLFQEKYGFRSSNWWLQNCGQILYHLSRPVRLSISPLIVLAWLSCSLHIPNWFFKSRSIVFAAGIRTQGSRIERRNSVAPRLKSPHGPSAPSDISHYFKFLQRVSRLGQWDTPRIFCLLFIFSPKQRLWPLGYCAPHYLATFYLFPTFKRSFCSSLKFFLWADSTIFFPWLGDVRTLGFPINYLLNVHFLHLRAYH